MDQFVRRNNKLTLCYSTVPASVGHCPATDIHAVGREVFFADIAQLARLGLKLKHGAATRGYVG